MGRGNLEIKKIENTTNRQVTYSKRRLGLMKKARELTVLCDAQVSLVMLSSSGKFAEYCSPCTDMKSILESYQKVSGIDLWSSQYKRMQNTLQRLQQINDNLRKEIRQRMGEDLDVLDIKELRGLEQSLDESLKLVRSRKYHVITTQTDTFKKKVKNSQEAHRSLLLELKMRDEKLDYGLSADDDPRRYGNVAALANGGTHMFSIRLQTNQPNFHGVRYESYGLRLA